MATDDEGTPFQSKKFLAYVIAETTWKIALMVILILGMRNGTIDLIVGGLTLAIVIIAGFIEVVYVGGQAALDKYVRIAQIAAQNGKGVSIKGMQITPGSHKNDGKPSDKEESQ